MFWFSKKGTEQRPEFPVGVYRIRQEIDICETTGLINYVLEDYWPEERDGRFFRYRWRYQGTFDTPLACKERAIVLKALRDNEIVEVFDLSGVSPPLLTDRVIPTA